MRTWTIPSWHTLTALLGTLAFGGEPDPLVAAYPGPGWRSASPRTGITFAGTGPAALGNIQVTGSVSGPHTGRVHALRSEPGAVFTPDRRFTDGEQVTVRTGARIMGAAGGTFSFTVVRARGPRHTPEDLGPASRLDPGRPTSAGIGTCRLRRPRYRTLPRLRPVGMCVSRGASAGGRGRILVTPRSHPERDRSDQHSVMVLSDRGEPLWYSARPNVARDLKIVRHRGQRMLAFYEWAPRGRSFYALLDRRYRLIARIRAGNDYRINTHELQVTPAGTAYVSAYRPVRLSGLPRPVLDFVIQEIDLETGDVLFEWHALDHVQPSASYEPPRGRGSWDYFHGNSIEPPASRQGTIIVSARNTSAVYGIDRSTGAVRWVLGGRRDQFALGARRFCAQHDARRQPNGDITLFDNGGAALGNMRDCPVHKARVLRFRLDLHRRRARLVRTIRSEPSSETGAGYFVWAMGNAQRQANGDMLISWGTSGRLTRVTRGGRVRFAMALGRYTYRAVRGAWVGRPRGRPAVVAHRDGGAVSVWASWNGATEIDRWRVLAGDAPSRLRRVGRPFAFHGLETRLRVPTRSRYVAVLAVSRRGRVLGRSPVVRVA